MRNIDDPLSALNFLLEHPACLRHQQFLTSQCFSPPFWESKEIILVTDESTPILSQYGLRLIGSPGSNNVVVIDYSMRENELQVDFNGKSNCTVLLGKGSPVSGRIRLASDNSLFSSSGFVNQGQRSHINVVVGQGGAAVFGKGVSSISSSWIIEYDCALIIGDDCMISWDVEARNYDSHAIVDLTTLDVINRPGDIIIGSHCWMGQKVIISKGLKIGKGSILGIGSIATSDIPPRSAAAGVPARVVRNNVSWFRYGSPSASAIKGLSMSLTDDP